jgi:hypothetical protein
MQIPLLLLGGPGDGKWVDHDSNESIYKYTAPESLQSNVDIEQDMPLDATTTIKVDVYTIQHFYYEGKRRNSLLLHESVNPSNMISMLIYGYRRGE